MSDVSARASADSLPSRSGLVPAVVRHPVISFFILAFAGTWLLYVPVLLSPRGLGVLPIPDGLVFPFFLLSTYAGPFLAAWLVTRAVDGPQGVRRWFRRMLQWRVGWAWYLIVLIGYPLVFGLPALLIEGPSAVAAAQRNLLAFIPGYLVTIIVGFFAPTLGEEAGWRGFALSRLQPSRGPIVATLIVSVIHAIWHLPAYFVKGAITETGAFDATIFLANSLAIIAASFIWTWLFNRTGESILFATFVHAASNGMSANLPGLLELTTPSPWFAFAVAAVVALLLIALTRGRLGHGSPNPA